MSRLERLVSLLDTGSSAYVRNVAGDQLADVQRAHPEELFGLLGRVVPFLRSPKWDTRISAARAISLVLENAPWSESSTEVYLPIDEKVEVKEEIKEEDGAIKREIKEEIVDEFEINPQPTASDTPHDLLSFSSLEIQNVIKRGTPLLGSAGKEFETAQLGMDPAERLRAQQAALKKTLGIAGFDNQSDDILMDEDLELAPPPKKKRGKPKATKKEPAPAPEPVDAEPKMNARMRALAKRKAKFGSKQPSKVHIVDSPTETSGSSSNQVVVEHKPNKAAELADIVTVKDPRAWPFGSLALVLMSDMFNPSWEVRHGALLGLRELVKVHGSTAGRYRGSANNDAQNSKWLEDLACKLCCIFALDRFADYVADQVVAPVRESCAQAMGALLLHLPLDIAEQTFQVLKSLVLQQELGIDTPVWAVCHGGMLGLRYFVSVRTDILIANSTLFDKLVECVFHGLENKDDDVQAISAATLLPIAQDFVLQRSEDIEKLLNVIWDSLSDLKDELSTSIGNVMDLLAKLCSYPQVLDILKQTMRDDPEKSYEKLIPRLYPFLRHSITDVRRAVLRTLNIFLAIESKDAVSWIDLRFFRLLFQNIFLEQKKDIALLSLDLWDSLMNLMTSDCYHDRFEEIFTQFSPIALSLMMTPVGTSRRFYKVDSSLLIKPSGAQFDSVHEAKPDAHHVNFDGPILLGDVLIVDPAIFIRARVLCATALGHAMGIIPAQHVDAMLPTLDRYFDSPMSSQHLSLSLLLEEYGRHAKCVSAKLREAVNPRLIKTMENSSEAIYRDLNPILRAVRTQCQSLFGLMVSQGELDRSCIPPMATSIEGDVNAGPDAFNLVVAEKLANETFADLKSKLADDIQVSMSKTLEEGRKNLESAITEARESLQVRNISIKACSAAAFITLSDSLPAKLNPIIRSLMDGIKMELNEVLHERTASTVSGLIATLISIDRGATANKVVKNLCSFVCVDTSEAPVFNAQKDFDGIMSTLKDEIPVDDITEALRKQKEKDVALIKRSGAIMALKKLAIHYGKDLFTSIEEVPLRMMGALRTADVNKLKDDTEGQAVIDNLAVTRAVLPFLDNDLYPEIEGIFDAIREALLCKYSVIRFVAAKCFATVCKVMPTQGITYFVEKILPEVSNSANLAHRQGAVEVTYHIMINMGEDVLPYIVFFIVPILGRMSDADIGIRTIAATTFAAIIKLVPLESGIADPSDMPKKLLEGRDKEREFISQMMDVSKVKPFDLPVSINATLRKYQQEGVNWLAFLNKYHLHGILCDDMGLGKTLQTICIVASDHYNREHTEGIPKIPSLIICPTTLTGHWIQEFKTYVPSLRTLAYVGSPSSRSMLTAQLSKVDVVVTSYDIARNDVATLSKLDWNYCVLDEGHIIKNANSKLSRCIKQYISEHRLILSGTPIQNNVLELWSLFDFLMPGFLGTEKSFNEQFSKPIIASRNSSKTSAKEQEAATLALEALHKQVLPFLLRRLKEDVLNDLPPKIIQDYYCDLNDKQRKLYEAFTQQQKKTVEGELQDQGNKEARKHIFQALLYMRRLCNHPAFVSYTKEELQKHQPLDYTQSPKLLALQQLLKDCGIGVDQPAAKTDKGEIPAAMSQHRALIFCQQKDMLDLVENSLLKQGMSGVSYMRLDSSVSGPGRHEMVTKFNEDPSIDVLLLSTHVGGLGLNLTGADTVIFVEHDWNPMNDLQAMDRAHRIGQKKVVNVYRLITRDTLEERIMGLQEFKLNIASTVINQQNSGLMSMGTDQILDLFSASTTELAPEEPKKTEEHLDATGNLGGNKFANELGELWDENEYAEEYNLDSFISSIRKKN